MLLLKYLERLRIAWKTKILTAHVIGMGSSIWLVVFVGISFCISSWWLTLVYREQCVTSGRTWKLREGFETDEQWHRAVTSEMSRLSIAGLGKVCMRFLMNVIKDKRVTNMLSAPQNLWSKFLLNPTYTLYYVVPCTTDWNMDCRAPNECTVYNRHGKCALR